MKLSIIIPVHNEEHYVGEVLKRIFALELLYEKEIIVIDDGSTDNTNEILERLVQTNIFKLLKHERNLGKGQAIKTGLDQCTGDLIIIQDADLEYHSDDIPLLLNKISSDVSAVYGGRGSKRWPKRGFHYILGAKILTFTINILFGGKLTDAYTGYKLFNVNKIGIDLLKNLKSTGFEFEAEVTCKILSQKGKILEVPINYVPRSKKEGKHIGPKDMFKGFYTILQVFISNQSPSFYALLDTH